MSCELRVGDLVEWDYPREGSTGMILKIDWNSLPVGFILWISEPYQGRTFWLPLQDVHLLARGNCDDEQQQEEVP
jgi:hypothetical protein